jgi:uncharacterized protein YndB with AHSA1/START domain
MNDYGELQRHDGTATVRFTRRLRHPIDKVWRAVSEPEGLAAWFPTTIEGERAAGAPLTFAFVDFDMAPMHGTMIAFDPPHLIELWWGEDRLRIELRADGDGTELVLSDTFAEIGKAARDGAGWHACLERLTADLDGAPAPAEDGWTRVHPSYVDSFGPDAATIGPPEEAVRPRRP